MRPVALSVFCLCFVALAGCEKTDPDMKPHGPLNLSHRAMNEGLINQYTQDEIDNAVIRQHTLYPYHFVQQSDQLNSLGRREVYVLAWHYKNYPGPVNLRQGDETKA